MVDFETEPTGWTGVASDGALQVWQVSMTCTRMRLLTLALCLWIAGSRSGAAEVRRVLLSVQGLSIPATESIRSFHLKTWGVAFVSVCHVPPSWELKSEKFEDPEGYLDGRSDTYGEQLRQLSNMYLLDVYDYQPLAQRSPGIEHPALFTGWVEIGRMQPFDAGTLHRRTLKASNFSMQNAQACPIAPPAQP